MLKIDRDLEDYILKHSDAEDEILYKLNKETQTKIYHPRRISGHFTAKVLQYFCKMIKPENVLEIGTFTGYAAISIAKSLPENGILHTFEINDEYEEIAKKYFKEAEVHDKIKIYIGNALSILQNLDIIFDLIYIDGNKKEYPEYYQLSKSKLRKNGFMIADNVLWDAKVLEPVSVGDHFTKGILTFNDMVQNDAEVENILLPIGDGMMLIRKK